MTANRHPANGPHPGASHAPWFTINSDEENSQFIIYLANAEPEEMEMYYIHYCGQQVLYNINPVPNYDEITQEAKTKFGLMVEKYDLEADIARLAEVVQPWREVQGVLQAILEDEMADFNAEDFARLEKEDRDWNEMKRKEREGRSEQAVAGGSG